MLFYKKFEPLLHLGGGRYDTFALTGGRGSMKTGHACRADTATNKIHRLQPYNR